MNLCCGQVGVGKWVRVKTGSVSTRNVKCLVSSVAGALPFRSWKALGRSETFELRSLPAPAGGNGVGTQVPGGIS